MAFKSISWMIHFCLIYCNYNFVVSVKIKDLNGVWRVKDVKEKYNLLGNVPGGIYSDLMRSDIIDDVFYGFNDVKTRWVSKTDWIYYKNFSVNPDLLSHDNINLVLDGVDTFTEILINGHEVGRTINMFVRYIFDVRRYLKRGDNFIEVRFRSAVNKAKELFDKQAKDYPIVPLCVPEEYNGECHANHARKVQASFAWDWGPAIPSMGIWKRVYLEAYTTSLLRDVAVNTSLDSKTKQWSIMVSVYLAENLKKDTIIGNFTVTIRTDRKEEMFHFNHTIVQKNKGGDYIARLQLSVNESDVQLWWPNGYGEAKLYPLDLRFLSLNGEDVDRKTLKIGFRTVKLVENKIRSGRSFFFLVNGVQVFAKGSNSIPINILPELSHNESTIRFLLQSAKDVHMNMIRVWGGGSYEADTFYEIADEMGIMIWQDFMFACAMYPADEEFLKNVKEEVKHQVRRLQYHPSIVLWAGNNENEAALRQNWYGTKHNFSLYKEDYIKLYVDTIAKELPLHDNSRQYLVSSPTNGIRSIEEGYVAENPQSHFYGDVHFYNYENDSWSSATLPINRFASEYGQQSLPSMDTLLTATDSAEDLVIGSQFFKSRQHLPGGFNKMLLLMDYQLCLPCKNNENYYKAVIYYSQIMQAMAIKVQTEFYRQWRSQINSDGEGLTMGALYWQLNDVWVAPTWSSIDFQQNWKMLHYYAKRFFAPIIITANLTNDGELDIYTVSDVLEEISDAVANIRVYNWNSFVAVHNDSFKINILANGSNKIKSLRIEEYLSQINGKPCGLNPHNNCFFYFTLDRQHGETIAPDNFIFPVPLKQATLPKPTITISHVNETEVPKEYVIVIETDAISLFVWLEAKGIRGKFSDNGFLQVTATKTVKFYSEKSVQLDDLKGSLSVLHLMMYFECSADNFKKC